MTQYINPDVDEDEKKESEEDIKERIFNDYLELFTKLGYEKSYKLVNYYQMKILKYQRDYKNPERKKLISKLKEMRSPYMKVFKKDII